MKKLGVLAFFLTAIFASTPVLLGQGVLGVGNFIHVVADLDKSIEFYHDGLGLEMTGAPGPHAFSANAVVSSLYDAPGAQSRVTSFKIPDSPMAIEIVEFQGLNATPVKAKLGDPGTITLSLPVKNVEETKARLLQMKGLVWVSASTVSVTVRDPDGIFVSLSQARTGPSANTSPAPTVRFGITVENIDAATQFYANALGFMGSKSKTGAKLEVPGDGFPVDFTAPAYADRKQVHAAIHDPGSGVLRLRVGDFDGVVKSMKAAGATVVSVGGEPVNLGRNRAVIFRELNNFFVQILESPQPAVRGAAPGK